ncbi:hypothetical protein Asulf_00875 [Archaeoglobus sulfaticallidus PM70-1]|uniref:Uncharacterized protein n=1 Tax=Archaeoglobus sulfaticallidus PM70-1 TaxID=387631 RepID=N0BF31_9EURY|nr:hypothetical protein [Archaeoglobus sulfaticallidus]AGK60882.1 hypothetical protein Asulf_00875 [Archaeoglobus sulfaticallidus PM70-1]
MRYTLAVLLVLLTCAITVNAQNHNPNDVNELNNPGNNLLDIKKIEVLIENDSVIVNLRYNVDAIQKFQVLLFGAMSIKDILENHFAGWETLKVDSSEAIFKMNLVYINGTAYFKGLKLNDSFDLYLNISGSSIYYGTTDEIPEFFYS